MYDIELDSEEEIKKIKDWLNERKLTHIATPNAGTVFGYFILQ